KNRAHFPCFEDSTLLELCQYILRTRLAKEGLHYKLAIPMTRLFSTLKLVLLLAFLVLPSQPAAAQTQPTLPLGQARNFTISSKGALEVLVKYTQPENETVALRLETTSYSNASLLVVVRQQLILHTWLLPYTFVDVSSTGEQSAVESFQSVTRTICPPHLSTQTPDQQQQQQQVYLRVTTESAALVTVSARAQLASNFRLSLGEPVQVLLQPSGPQLFFFDFDSGRANFTELRAVRILVESNDSACGLVSVQRSRCPADQVPPSVLQRGFRQTLLSSSVILMRRDEFNSSFLVVLTAFPDNRNCLANWEQQQRQRFSSKSVTIKVEQIAMPDSAEWALVDLTFLLGFIDCAVAILVAIIFYDQSCKPKFLSILLLVSFYFSVISFALSFVVLLFWFFKKLLCFLILLVSGVILLIVAVIGYLFGNWSENGYDPIVGDSCNRHVIPCGCGCHCNCSFSLYCMHCHCCGSDELEPPENINAVADHAERPENNDAVADHAERPENNDAVADHAERPENNDAVADHAERPENNDAVADHAERPENNDAVADHAERPENNDAVADHAERPENNDAVADHAERPENNDAVADHAERPENNDAVADHAERPENNDAVADHAERPENNDAVADHANLNADNQGQSESQHASLVMQLTAIAIFYCLPVFQLVLLQQNSISSFGNLDECYYNFKCRFYVKTELTTFFAFNNAVSNVGYVTAGIVFMVVVFWKQLFLDKEKITIPRCYSAHYAAGLALAMEGVLSACYHICPSHNTFQFDTTFMIMLSSMLGLAVYSKRHLSSGSVANVTFVALGVTVLVNSLGILFSLVSREFVFSLLGVVLLLLAIVSGFMLIFALIVRKKQFCQHFLTFLAAFVCFAAGIASFLVGFLFEHVLFAYFLLFVTAGSAVLYFLYYCIRKFCRKTRPRIIMSFGKLRCGGTAVVFFFLLFFGLLILAVVYFFKAPTDWQGSPAESRDFNSDCSGRLFGLPFDQHDLWHLIGSQALLCLLLFVLFMDFDEERKKLAEDRIF
ncbi:hypothetical protein BOX15_Mlig005546g1, partial [Macrostomum lignano]